MINRENTCKACEGTGMLSDDEGWQYSCSVCRGTRYLGANAGEAEVKDTDDNNRLLD